MPLLSGSSREVIGSNISELERAGHPKAQSIAIALQKAGKSNKDEDLGNISSNSTKPEVIPMQSAKHYDDNNWPEIKGNPISKVGVFPYSGAQIGHPSLDPNKIYMVYRPDTELSDEDTINSFKLLPFTDEHAMLGSEDEGLMPAEKKGLHGVIGQDVYFEDGYLKANLKIFSEKLNELIRNGKKELSIGYRCMYDIQSGIYDGQPYDAIQRQIRGNHIALVEEGRSGPDVAVLDRLRFTLDSKDIQMPDMTKPQGEPEDLSKPEGNDNMENEVEKENLSVDNGEMDFSAIFGALREALAHMEKMMANGGGAAMQDAEPKDFVKKANITDVAETEEKEAEKEEGKKDKKVDEEVEKEGKAMDEKTIIKRISQRDELAEKLSWHIGTFDHKEKTLEEVAEYGISKLKLTCKPGHETSVLQGFFAAAKIAPASVAAQDSVERSSQIDEYIKGAK